MLDSNTSQTEAPSCASCGSLQHDIKTQCDLISNQSKFLTNQDAFTMLLTNSTW